MSIRMGFGRRQVTNCGWWGCVSCSTKAEWTTPCNSAAVIPRSCRCRGTHLPAGLYPFLVPSAHPWWLVLWSSPCCSSARDTYTHDLEGKNPQTQWLSLCSVYSLRIPWRGQETLLMLIWRWPCGELALLPCVNFVSLERAVLCAQPPKQG